MTEPRSLGPVREFERIQALDAARGFALVGIFLVNINTFGEAFGYFMAHEPRGDRGQYEWICRVLGKALWEGRFYPLFSMLFGMGLVIQYQRAKAAGRSFAPATARRLVVLALIGISHALLLWYGDILFLYGMIGLLMIALVPLAARTLGIIAGAILGVAMTLTIGFGLLGARHAAEASHPQPTTAAVVTPAPAPAAIVSRAPAPAEAADAPAIDVADGASADDDTPDSPISEWLQGIRKGTITPAPQDPRWIELETRAYREGPWLDAFAFRVMTWGGMLVISCVFFGWFVLAMFCLGAALMKWNFFHASRGRWHVALVVIAGVIVAPISFALAVATTNAASPSAEAVGSAVLMLLGPLMALGYLSAITLIVRHRLLPRAVGVLSAAGRMAFTNYLMQTVLATAIFYHWGLGLFDTTTRVERIGIVLGIYAFQLAFSVCWLKVFAMGPLEWLWRTATYLRFPPLLRRGPSTEP